MLGRVSGKELDPHRSQRIRLALRRGTMLTASVVPAPARPLAGTRRQAKPVTFAAVAIGFNPRRGTRG